MRVKKLDPIKDPTSLGNLLVAAGQCTQADVDAAVRYQREHPDELLGEYLVKLGVISQGTLEIAVARQRAARGGNGAIRQFAQLAVQRTRSVSAGIDKLALAKLK